MLLSLLLVGRALDLVKHLQIYMFIDKMETCKVDYGIRNGQIYDPEKVVKKRIPLDGRNFKVTLQGWGVRDGESSTFATYHASYHSPILFSFKKW